MSLMAVGSPSSPAMAALSRGRGENAVVALFPPHGRGEQVAMQVVQIGHQMEGVFQVAATLFALGSQEVHQVGVPQPQGLFLLVVEVGLRLDERLADPIGRELQRTQHIL